MKVLWFVNTCGNSKILNLNNRGGWISSLETAILENSDTELALAFPSDITYYWKDKQVTYYGLKVKHNTKIKRLFQRYLRYLPNEIPEKRILNIIVEFKPNIIHIHGTENLFGLIIDKVEIPTIVSIQGNITVLSKKYFSGISREDTKRNTSVLDYLAKGDLIFKYKMFLKQSTREQKTLKSVKYVIGRTDWDRRICRVLAPDSKYFHGDEILRNLFYINAWKKAEGNGEYYLISVLGTDLYKGLETILQSARLLLGNNFSFIWNVAGINYHDQVVRIIEAQEKATFKECNIKFMGSLNEKYLVDLMLKSDLFVSPSHIENSPNNVCEAMILGMPIIATCAGGTSSLLEDRKEGILIQDGDPWAMAGAILEMSENEKEAIALGVAARNRALNRHNPRKIAADYINIYNKILELENSYY